MLYGRTREQGTLDRLLAEAAGGASGVLVVSGDPGVGKSALLDHAVERAGAEFTVLRGMGVESEAELPYAGLHLLLAPVLGRVEELPEVQATALRGALGMSTARAGDRFLVGVAVLSLLAAVAAERPLLCVMDDTQWLDRASADALLFAARRLRSERVALLLAAREEFHAPGLPELRVSPLESPAAGELVDAVAPGLATDVRERVLAEAGGNPLGLIELPRGVSGGDLGELPLTRRLLEAFGRRATALGEPAGTLLLVAAAEDTGEPSLIMRAASRLGVGEQALEECERSGLVEVTAGRVRFRHPLVRSAVYQAAGFARRGAVHRALAEVSEPERRIWHLAAAVTGTDEELAAELARSAEAFARRSGHAAAAAWERAALLTPEPGLRTVRLANAAEAAISAGRLGRAARLTDQAVRLTGDGLVLARLANLRADVDFERGAVETASLTLLEAARPLASAHPGRAAALLIQVVRNAWYAHDLKLSRQATDLLASLGHGADPARPALAMASGITALLEDDPERALPLLRQVVEGGRHVDHGEHGLRNNALAIALLVGDHTTALNMARALAAECASLGMVAWLPHTHLALASVELLRGRHLDAAADADHAEQVAAQTGQTHLEAQARGVRAWLAAVRGAEEDCRRLAGRAAATPSGQVWAQWALGLLELARGRYQQAADHLARAARRQPAAAPDLVEVLVRLREPERARAAHDRFVLWAEASGQAWARGLLARCRALLDGDERDFATAIDLHRAADRPFDAARTRLLLGERLRRERRKQEARPVLREAADTFERLGAAPWLDRASSELRATGESPARSADAALLARLTPQELQVVRLAATGATNKEIAARLFLSPRTVGHHLYKAYPKLGVTTRTELAGLILS
ncbi:LuxR family transcriptional regulator [Actinomadura kijaniata]|uniref:DNA-binding CsgD family transcriptional regulator n=1 Tax=Actinomadura namibiensis TaxID=182080 RepID=A0A7W3LRN4_ACTNM|nr:LuxR family transcriptional regulator [Actinomadura namibiensis]MBA8952950.1 DNA-binding CsgD family transcriptional regulator [Actinomadura namibiensis]